MTEALFSQVPPFAGDPILSLNQEFQKDPNPDKVNLSIGIYTDDEGRIPVLAAVREAERRLAAQVGPKPYLPMEGMAAYRGAVRDLLFGAGSAVVREQRVAELQSLGGSGALKVGADFLKRYYPQATVWVSEPTWDNHRAMFEGAGFEVRSYPYYDAATRGLAFEPMLDALARLPVHDIVVLHACCHNPTGVDLSPEQWLRVRDLLVERRLIAFVDIAYQGFGDGIDEDAQALRLLADAGLSFFVANSFSKSFSLYGERCGGLSVVCASADEAARVLGQLQFAVRRNYSNPPTHGPQLVATILIDPALRRMWADELAAMRTRIAAMRQALRARLEQLLPARDWAYLTTQRGMFSYTGLTPEQADRLRFEQGVYVLRSGRMCMAGLSERNVERVAQAFARVLAH
jgi:aromatic-amino-acid transaminase